MEIILTPFQASSIPYKSGQEKSLSCSPLPPITKEQISQGELSSLLVEEDYNLSTMVSKFFKNKTLLSYCTFQSIFILKLLIFF